MKPMTLFELNSIVRLLVQHNMPDTYWVQGELS
jgi:hypothetical protein